MLIGCTFLVVLVWAAFTTCASSKREEQQQRDLPPILRRNVTYVNSTLEADHLEADLSYLPPTYEEVTEDRPPSDRRYSIGSDRSRLREESDNTNNNNHLLQDGIIITNPVLMDRQHPLGCGEINGGCLLCDHPAAYSHARVYLEAENTDDQLPSYEDIHRGNLCLHNYCPGHRKKQTTSM